MRAENAGRDIEIELGNRRYEALQSWIITARTSSLSRQGLIRRAHHAGGAGIEVQGGHGLGVADEGAGHGRPQRLGRAVWAGPVLGARHAAARQLLPHLQENPTSWGQHARCREDCAYRRVLD